jgi:glycosyltransferase 2 family protein
VEKLGRNLVLAAALGIAVYAALFFFLNFGEVSRALAGFDFALIPVILGLVSLSYAGRFVRWLYYLRVLKVSVPLGQNAAIFMAGLSMTISPGKLGEVLKSVFVRQASGAPIARTAPAVVAERATDGTGMVAWGFLGAFALGLSPYGVFAFLAIAVLGIAVLRSERLSLLAERILLRLPLLDRLAPHLRAFHGASNELLGTRPLLIGTAISFLSWGIECLAVYLCAVGLGANTSFLMVVFVFATSSLLGVLSMIPGGIGAVEAGLALQFRQLADLSSGLAGALTLVIRLATLWWATLLGIFGLLLVRRMLGDAPLDSDSE